MKVDLRLPHGFHFLSYKKVPGWKTKLTKTKLAKPVTLEGLKVDREMTPVVQTGNRKNGGIIAPDHFEEFALSVRVPDGKAGDQLVSRAIQTYRGGEKVRWNRSARLRHPGTARDAPGSRRGERRAGRTAAAALLNS